MRSSRFGAPVLGNEEEERGGEQVLITCNAREFFLVEREGLEMPCWAHEEEQKNKPDMEGKGRSEDRLRG